MVKKAEASFARINELVGVVESPSSVGVVDFRVRRAPRAVRRSVLERCEEVLRSNACVMSHQLEK